MSTSTSYPCVTDCSILNQTTCQLMQPKQFQAEQEEIDSNMWNQKGCYNSKLFKSTLEFKNYEKARQN